MGSQLIKNERLSYTRIAAGLTTHTVGGLNAGAGDYLSHVVLQPAAVGAGTTTIFDGTTTVIVYTAGTLSDLSPKTVPLGATSAAGAWNITTGASMAVTAFWKSK